MQFEQYTLKQSFERIGMWTPDYKQLDAAVTGVLSVRADQYTLKLFGHTKQFENKRMIYGYTEDGKLIWIPNYKKVQTSKPDSRFAVTELKIDALYLFSVDPESFSGRNIIAEAFDQIFQNSRFDFQVHHLSFSTNYLLKWMGQEPVLDDDESESEIRMPYGTVQSTRYNLPNNFLIQLDVNQVMDEEATTIQMKQSAEIRIQKQSAEKSWFRTLHNEAISLVKLLDFLGGWIHAFTYLHFEIKPGIRGRYLFNQRHIQQSYPDQEVHTTYVDLEDKLEKVLLNYIQKRKKLDLVLDDYLSEFYLVEFYETKLLNSIRNLEIYHRNFVEPREAKEKDDGIEEARTQIIDFINEEVFEKYQGRFRSQVYYQPEKSLRKRMATLIKNVPNELFDELEIKSPTKRKSRSIGSFVNRLVETRHFYTHGDFPENYPSRIVEQDQIKRVNQTLRQICLYYVYKELGLDEKIILKKIR